MKAVMAAEMAVSCANVLGIRHDSGVQVDKGDSQGVGKGDDCQRKYSTVTNLHLVGCSDALVKLN